MDLDIYNDMIMEHSMNSFNKKEIPYDFKQLGHNPNCGDEIEVEVKIDDGKISDIAFLGHGCAISQASASIMADVLRGKTVEQAKEILEIFSHMIKREQLTPEQLEKLEDAQVFENVSNMPARVKCAMLSWHTLEEILKQLEEK